MKTTKKKSLVYLLLIPLLVVVALQGLLPFSALLASGTRKTLENNAIDLNSHAVENRRVVLENAMVDQWSAVRKENGYLNNALLSLLAENNSSADAFLNDADLQRAYAGQVFPELLDYLRRDSSCGVFLILANSTDPTQPGDYTGFFLRDSDPSTRTETNSDLLLERGDKAIARKAGITLDSAWVTGFSFHGSGQNSADDFFYKPYLLAQEHPNVDMSSLGYWAAPFILGDPSMDNHRMITYSVPLVCQGTVYGVVGTEVSVSYLLSSYFSLRDLDRNQNAGYVIAIDYGDGAYQEIAGKGSLYDAVSRDDNTFSFSATSYSGLYQVDGGKIGNQNIYAVLSPLKLYENRVPYENKDWVLCAFLTESSIFGLGDRLYRSIFTAIIGCAAFGMVIMFLVVRQSLRPVYRLMDSVRGGIDGLKAFRPSHVLEVDELHEVVQTLTESELKTERQLSEEKERYRMAVESSNDMFFTYRESDQTLELVNTRSYDGIWELSRLRSAIIDNGFSQKDLQRITAVLHSGVIPPHMQLFFRRPDKTEGRWLEICGKSIPDAQDSRHWRLVGYVRDIHEQKMQELERAKKNTRDPVTSFYRLEPGLQALHDARTQQPCGILVFLDLSRFSYITQTFGLTFGDAVLEDFSALVSDLCQKYQLEKVISIRAGADEFLIWLPETEKEPCLRMSPPWKSVIRL